MSIKTKRTHTHESTHTCTHAHAHIHAHTHALTNTHAHACTHTHALTCTSFHLSKPSIILIKSILEELFGQEETTNMYPCFASEYWICVNARSSFNSDLWTWEGNHLKWDYCTDERQLNLDWYNSCSHFAAVTNAYGTNYFQQWAGTAWTPTQSNGTSRHHGRQRSH